MILPPVSDQEKCLPIYDNIIGIRENFGKYGIVWSDIGIDNLGVKNGHLAVIDLGETYGGTIKGKEITLTLRKYQSKTLNKEIYSKTTLSSLISSFSTFSKLLYYIY